MKFSARLFLAALLLFSAPAWASSVLLPEDSNNGSTGGASGNMGLSPEVPTPSAPAVSAPQTAKTPAAPKNTGTTATPQNNSDLSNLLTMGNVSIKPGGTVPKSATTPENATALDNLINGQVSSSGSGRLSAIEQRIQDYKAAEEKKYQSDSTIIEERPIEKSNKAALPGSLTVSVDGKYLWGTDDVKQITRYLGYKGEQIPQNCQLRMDVQIETNTSKFKYGDSLYSGQQSSIGYEGTLQTVSFQPRAVCNPPQAPLPRNGGIIMKTGNKYSVLLLGSPSCQPTQNNSGTPFSLTVQYIGDSKVQCAFR